MLYASDSGAATEPRRRVPHRCQTGPTPSPIAFSQPSSSPTSSRRPSRPHLVGRPRVGTKPRDAHYRAIRSVLRPGSSGARRSSPPATASLACFDGPGRAVRCSKARSSRTRREGKGLHVRVGMHTGECERRDDDIAGIAVHVAARVGSPCQRDPDEVLVSRTVTKGASRAPGSSSPIREAAGLKACPTSGRSTAPSAEARLSRSGAAPSRAHRPRSRTARRRA